MQCLLRLWLVWSTMDPGDEINARPHCQPEELFKNPRLAAALAGIIQHNRKRHYTFSKHMVLLVKCTSVTIYLWFSSHWPQLGDFILFNKMINSQAISLCYKSLNVWETVAVNWRVSITSKTDLSQKELETFTYLDIIWTRYCILSAAGRLRLNNSIWKELYFYSQWWIPLDTLTGRGSFLTVLRSEAVSSIQVDFFFQLLESSLCLSDFISDPSLPQHWAEWRSEIGGMDLLSHRHQLWAPWHRE